MPQIDRLLNCPLPAGWTNDRERITHEGHRYDRRTSRECVRGQCPAANPHAIGITPCRPTQCGPAERLGCCKHRPITGGRPCSRPRMGTRPMSSSHRGDKGPPRNGMPPIHPGEILREEFMVPMALSPKDLADTLEVPEQLITDVVEERCAVTPDLAQRLAGALKVSPGFWNNLQATYEERKASTEGDASSGGSSGPGA